MLDFIPTDDDQSDIVGVGGTLHVDTLLEAYSQGIFPWPHHDYPLLWFSPLDRAVLDFSNVHIPKRLLKQLRNTLWTFRINTCFERVIQACSEAKRKGQKGTWITDELMEAYIELHKQGHAHSFEVFENNELIGGLYGVRTKKSFSGESMFHTKTSASKFALLMTVQHLKSEGFTWMDVQQLTPLLKSFGAHTITRADFFKRIS